MANYNYFKTKYLLISYLSKSIQGVYKRSLCTNNLIEKPFFNGFLKIIGVQNQLPITFCLDLVCNKTLKAEMRPHHTHEFLTLIFLLHIKSEQKVIRKYSLWLRF